MASDWIAQIGQSLDGCRQRAVDYWDSMRYEDGDALFWKSSVDHDPKRDPELLVAGSWAAVHSQRLLGVELTEDERQAAHRGLSRFQRSDGYFGLESSASRCPEQTNDGSASPCAVNSTYDDEYWLYHITNYAWGAALVLREFDGTPCAFMEPLLSRDGLQKWLAERDWSNPWKEGNNIVNLASFYAILAESGHSAARCRLDDMVDWHDRHQNPATGFWHLDDGQRHEQLLNAMAGRAHNLHLYYYLNRDIPNHRSVIDSCLRLGYMGLRIACIDIDLVDILVHFRRYEYRLDEIDAVLLRYLVELLQVQNRDGGFVNGFVQPDVLFGRPTRAGRSVSWATWFRLVTLGMAACALIPSERDRWRFRSTLGMGYCNLGFAVQSVSGVSTVWQHPVNPKWLAARREARFTRQRVTRLVRLALKRAKSLSRPAKLSASQVAGAKS